MPYRIFKIYLSAGHGVYFNDDYKQWMTQQRNYCGMVEDFWTVLLARELFVLLDEDSRFQVFMNRDLFNEEIGESGHQKWMEASNLFFQEVRAPQSVWNIGTGLARAVNADALGIKYYNADIALSIHSDSGGGENFGYKVWHHSLANYGKKLATILEESLLRLPSQSRWICCNKFMDQHAFWRESRGIVMSVIDYFYYDHQRDNEQMKLQKNISHAAQITYQGISEFIEIYGNYLPEQS